MIDSPETSGHSSSRSGGGRAARHAHRAAQAHAQGAPFLTRALKPYEVLDEEGLSLIEHNADTILEEVGIIFRGDPEAIATVKAAGADARNERRRRRTVTIGTREDS